MSKRVFSLLCLLPLIGMAPAWADAPASDKPDDYSHAMPLTVSGNQSVVQLRLPKDVYLHARSTQLLDLRLFDSQGNKLPFSLQAPAERAQSSRRDLPVRLFPVRGTARPGKLDADIEVRRSADGSVLSVSTRTGTRAADSGPQAIDALVLDLGPEGQRARIDALRFRLPAGVSSYNARVLLEVSDDLKQWDTVGDSDLSWLTNERGEVLASDRMDFEPRSFRYARLSWREGKPVQFAGISAESPLNTAVAPQMERLLIPPAPGRFPNDVVYASSPAIPVQRIGLDLGEQNVVLPAQLGRYIELPDRQGGKTSTWQFEQLAAATFYQLQQGGKRRASGDIAITPVHVAQWVLRAEAPLDKAPALRLAWTPSTLVFLANGKPPYRLSFGRSNARDGSRALAQVAPGFDSAEIAALESAVAGPLQATAAVQADGPGAVEKAAAAARTRMLALWAALLAGVGVLAYMAWRLMKQMK